MTHTAQQMLILQRGLALMRNADPEHIKMHDYHCGSAHCIGGWLAVANKMTVTQVSAAFDWSDYWASSISDLFYMWGYSLAAFDSLPAPERKELALCALTNFIETGHADWNTVLGDRIP